MAEQEAPATPKADAGLSDRAQIWGMLLGKRVVPPTSSSHHLPREMLRHSGELRMHFTAQRWGMGHGTGEPWDGARLALPQEGNDALQGRRWGLGLNMKEVGIRSFLQNRSNPTP